MFTLHEFSYFRLLKSDAHPFYNIKCRSSDMTWDVCQNYCLLLRFYSECKKRLVFTEKWQLLLCSIWSSLSPSASWFEGRSSSCWRRRCFRRHRSSRPGPPSAGAERNTDYWVTSHIDPNRTMTQKRFEILSKFSICPLLHFSFLHHRLTHYCVSVHSLQIAESCQRERQSSISLKCTR